MGVNIPYVDMSGGRKAHMIRPHISENYGWGGGKKWGFLLVLLYFGQPDEKVPLSFSLSLSLLIYLPFTLTFGFWC